MDAQYGAFWPFDPEHPDGSDQPAFKAGDYILVRGVLWQDQPHEGTYDRVDNWDRGPTEGHAAWLEIHPPDWIVRLDPPVPGLRKTVLTMSLITDHWETRDKIEEWVTDEFPDFDVRYPAFEVSSGNEKKKQVLKVRDVEELVDGRFTDLPTVWKHFILDMRDHARVEAGVRHSGSTKRQGRFKGAYLMAWEVPAPAASSLEPDADRLDVAVRGSDDGIWYQRWSGSGVSWGPAHPTWLPLGGDMTSDPAVVAMLPSLVYVFARGSDKALWFKWLTFPDKDKVQHSEWQSLGGVLTSAPAACSPGPDRLDVFARGADNNAMHHQWFDGKKWSGWHPLGGYGTSDPAAAAVGGTPWVFVRGADDAIYYMFVHDEVSGSGWQKLDCVATSAPAACSLAPDQDRLDVFVRASDNALWRRVFDGRGWSGWESLGGVWTSDPAVVAVGGNAWTLARGTDNALHFRIVSTTTPVTAWQWLAGETP
jgi:hypothetical protein